MKILKIKIELCKGYKLISEKSNLQTCFQKQKIIFKKAIVSAR